MFFCQAEDGIRDLVRSRGLGDVYKRQAVGRLQHVMHAYGHLRWRPVVFGNGPLQVTRGQFVQILSLIHI